MAITFGDAGAPSQKTVNLDALFALSLANYRRTLADNISTSNALWMRITRGGGGYTSVDGGTHIEEPLMYQVNDPDTFEGLDVLSTAPIDGITNSLWEWRQVSTPITISGRQEKQNKQRIVNLLQSKIRQAEIGMAEFIPKMMFKGNGPIAGFSTANLETVRVSPSNASPGVEPIPKLIKLDPTSSTVIGNINQNTSTWWRNQLLSSTGSTYEAFLLEMEDMNSLCAKGTGGPPDLIVCDRKTFSLLKIALYNRARHPISENIDFPFENIKWGRATVVWDEFVADIEGGLEDAADGSSKGTAYFFNTKFMGVRYESSSNFVTTEFQRPVNQDGRVAHILWMGNVVVSNRRKQGVLYGIDRTLT